jgi:HSP20 family molecular chaperone IbpA
MYLIMVGQGMRWWWGRPPGEQEYWNNPAAERLVGWSLVGLLIAVLALAVVVPVFTRLRYAAGGWWDRGWKSLVLVCLAFGVGVSSLGTFCMEYGSRNLSPVLVFLLPILATLALAACERGRRPLAGLFLAIGAGLVQAILRLGQTDHGRLGFWDLEDLFGLTLTFAILLPMLYLVAKGMIVLVGGQLGQGAATPLQARSPALELVRRDGVYLVRLEAAGAGDVGDVQATVYDGVQLDVTVELPQPSTEGLLFTTRRSGPLRVRARLPVPVEAEPRDVSVAHGLVEVALAPRGANAESGPSGAGSGSTPAA